MKSYLNKHEKMDRERIAKSLQKALLYVMVALGLTFWALVFAIFASGHAQAASFDCAKASAPVELSICSDAVLGALDEDIAVLYKQALAAYPTVKAEQRQWLKERNKMSGSALVVTHMERKTALQAMIAAPVAVANEPVESEHAVATNEPTPSPKPVAQAPAVKDTYDMTLEEREQFRRDNDAKAEADRLAHNKKVASKVETAIAVLDYIDEQEQFPANFGHSDSDMGKGGFTIERFLKSGVGKHDRCAKTSAYNYAWELIHLVDRSGERGTQNESYFWPLYYGANNALLYILQEHPERYESLCK